jgi:hypothetical protein
MSTLGAKSLTIFPASVRQIPNGLLQLSAQLMASSVNLVIMMASSPCNLLARSLHMPMYTISMSRRAEVMMYTSMSVKSQVVLYSTPQFSMVKVDHTTRWLTPVLSW